MEKVKKEQLPLVSSGFNLDPVVFDSISFERYGFRNKNEGIKTEFDLSYAIGKVSDKTYCVTLKAVAKQKDEYKASVQISGYCNFNGELPEGVDVDTLLKENVVAILFPYIRSEMTLITSQPEVEPVVWPVMNILSMFKQAEKSKHISECQKSNSESSINE